MSKKLIKLNERELKPIRPTSPIISGVNDRSRRILLTPGDWSSGIMAYGSRM